MPDDKKEKGAPGAGRSGRKKEISGQFARSKGDRRNNGTASAEPRVLSGDEEGDATFPLKQDE